MFIVLRNLYNFLTFLVLDFFIGLKKSKVNPKSLLLLRLDSIGDYILFRNFIKLLREDEKYRGYKITLCGNVIWKELAETLDCDVVNEFIWLEREKFLFNFNYKFAFLRMIHSKGFETVINSTYTREILFGDQIVKSSRANVKIGNSGSPDKKNRVTFFTNRFYTNLISASDSGIFEFSRNKEFFEKLLGKNMEIKKPVLDTEKIRIQLELPQNYFVVFPGANHISRIWNPDNFAEISKFLVSEYKTPVIIAASEKEKYLAERIKSICVNDDVFDLSGKTNLSQLSKIISETKLLITNDTGAVHIAAAVNKPFICISNGNHFGRFTPYPDDIFNKCMYIYPPDIMNNLDKPDELANKYRFNSDLDINSIPVEQVIEKIKIMLNRN